jgi:hypothetical protein
MNIVINCPHCSQEMIIDDSGVGASVPCPTCSKDFVIPQGRTEDEVKKEREATGGGAPKPEEKKKDAKKPMPSKEELDQLLPGAKKGPATKASEDKAGVKVKVFQHHLCIDMGKDLFPGMVADTLDAIDKEDIINISPLNYSYKDSGGDIITEFGVMIIYNHRSKKEGE